MPKLKPSSPTTTAEQAEKCDRVMPFLEAMFKEFQEATKRKPDAALNKRKVEIVNRLLHDVLDVLKGEANHGYIDLLDVDDLPQNSDVSLILGQATAAMQSFKEKYYGWDGSEHRWAIK